MGTRSSRFGFWSLGLCAFLWLPQGATAGPLGGAKDGEPCWHGGDVNTDGLVSAGDAQTAFFIALGGIQPTPEQFCAADCNGNGVVSAGDAQLIFYAAIGAGTCPASLSDGQLCTADEHCESGHCQNGHCCAAGDCCFAAADCAGLGYDGEPVCDTPATCQGSRQDAVCTGAFTCDAQVADDDSACGGDLEADDCGLYPAAFCTGEPEQTVTCASTCASDADCDAAAHCAGGTCVADLEDGAACDGAGDCLSGYCGNGTCCAAGDCCTEAADCTGLGYDGEPVCDTPATCQGSRQDAVCTGAFTCDAQVADDDSACGGDLEADDCGLYPAAFCTGEPEQTVTCASTCASDADCDAAAHCAGGTCVADLEDGAACDGAGECLSGYCGNGHCCAAGDCCAEAADCVGLGYGGEPVCDDPAQCQGSVENAVCGDFMCDSVVNDDDSGCTSAVEADACGYYLPVTCTGASEQPGAPSCPTACADDAECDPGRVCTEGACALGPIGPEVCANLGITTAEGGGPGRLNGRDYCIVKAADGWSCQQRCQQVAGLDCKQPYLDRFLADIHAASQTELNDAFFAMEPGWYGNMTIWPEQQAGRTGFSCNGGTAYILPTSFGTDDGACSSPVVPGALSCSATEHVGYAQWGYGSVCACGWGDTEGDPEACGTPPVVCALPNVAVHACFDGVCVPESCVVGWIDRNGEPADGCEAEDPMNCAGPGDVCALPNVAEHGCVAGVCTIVTCAAGYDDCDLDAETGCEQNIATDAFHCGACESPCGVGEDCAAGVCFEPEAFGFEVIESRWQVYQGINFLVVKVGLNSAVSATENWCREYEVLCGLFDLSPTGCGPTWDTGSYRECKTAYGSYAPDDVLSCNPSGAISTIAQQAGYGDATGTNSFGFHGCSTNSSSCWPTLCSGDYCNSALSYFDATKTVGYTVCRGVPAGGALPNGDACTNDSECASAHCQNGFCCTNGDCCAGPGDCPAWYSGEPFCDHNENCQGQRTYATCTNSACGSANIDDDAGCTDHIMASACGAYPAVYCNGAASQTAPSCPTSCATAADCDAGTHIDCVDGACVADWSSVCDAVGLTGAEGAGIGVLNGTGYCILKAANGSSCADRCTAVATEGCDQSYLNQFISDLWATPVQQLNTIFFGMEPGWTGNVWLWSTNASYEGWSCGGGTSYVGNTAWGYYDGSCNNPAPPGRMSCDGTQHVGAYSWGYGAVCVCGSGGGAGDPEACGEPPVACAFPHVAAHDCVSGACIIVTCEAGWRDADGHPSNGCETEDVENCGGLGPCELPNVTAHRCLGGECLVATCAAGYDDCNNDPADGCEIDIYNGSDNCGGCGFVCAAGDICRHGMCLAPSCDEQGITGEEGGGDGRFNGRSYCVVKTANGASCQERCQAVAGLDCYDLYLDRFRDDLWAASQLELDSIFFDMEPNWHGTVSKNSANLNQSGFSCSGGTAYVSNTPWGTDDGYCNNPWLPGTLSCAATQHVGQYSWGYGTVCVCGDGGLVGDPEACGEPPIVCDLPNVDVHDCYDGVCAIQTCDPGWIDENGSDADGCELEDVTNCGGLGPCELPNVATYTCVGGVCLIASCALGFDDCDGLDETGCEVDIDNDLANCGACELGCAPGDACRYGLCMPPSCDELGITGAEGGGDALFNGHPYCVVKAANGSSCQARCQAVAGLDCDSWYLTRFRDDLWAAAQTELDHVFVGMEPNWHGSISKNSSNLSNSGFSCSGGTAYVSNTPWGTDDGYCNNPWLPGVMECTRTSHVGQYSWGYGTVCVCGDGGLAGDPAACGDPPEACDLPHVAVHGCFDNACRILACDPTFADTNGVAADGCEACARGLGDCDSDLGNGCETDIFTDPANCGSCGHACAGGEECAAGVCYGGLDALQFEVLEERTQTYQGADFLVLRVGLKSNTAHTENWCREYQVLCAAYGLEPTGCGPNWDTGGYRYCKDQYGSFAPDNVLGCNPAGGVAAVATAAGYSGAGSSNSFGFHSCNTGSTSPTNCGKTLCLGSNCNSAISYIDFSQTEGFTVCRSAYERSCLGYYDAGYRTDGLYTIDPDGAGIGAPFAVYCDMTSDGGGWTLVTRALYGSNDHYSTGAVGTLADPFQATTAKLADSAINAIRVANGGYAASIFRLTTDTGVADYFRENRAFCGTCSDSSDTINTCYGTLADAEAGSNACAGQFNPGWHVGITGWLCYDYFIWKDQSGFRANAYQSGAAWVR